MNDDDVHPKCKAMLCDVLGVNEKSNNQTIKQLTDKFKECIIYWRI